MPIVSIHSHVERQKKGTEEHMRITAQSQAGSSASLPATPMIRSSREQCTEVDAESKASQRVASAPFFHARPNGMLHFSIPAVRKLQSDISIATVMYGTQPRRSIPRSRVAHKLPLPPLPTPSTVCHDGHPETSRDCHAFSAPRNAPVPPPRSHRPLLDHQANRRLPPAPKNGPCADSIVTGDDCSNRSHGCRTHSVISSYSSVESAPRISGGSQHSSKLYSLSLPKFGYDTRPAAAQISSPYGSEKEFNCASSTIPTWRYDDFTTDTHPPVMVESLPRTQSRSLSLARSLFHANRNVAFTH